MELSCHGSYVYNRCKTDFQLYSSNSCKEHIFVANTLRLMQPEGIDNVVGNFNISSFVGDHLCIYKTNFIDCLILKHKIKCSNSCLMQNLVSDKFTDIMYQTKSLIYYSTKV